MMTYFARPDHRRPSLPGRLALPAAWLSCLWLAGCGFAGGGDGSRSVLSHPTGAVHPERGTSDAEATEPAVAEPPARATGAAEGPPPAGVDDEIVVVRDEGGASTDWAAVLSGADSPRYSIAVRGHLAHVDSRDDGRRQPRAAVAPGLLASITVTASRMPAASSPSEARTAALLSRRCGLDGADAVIASGPSASRPDAGCGAPR